VKVSSLSCSFNFGEKEMKIVAEQFKFIDKKVVDSLISTYKKGLISHEAFVDGIISEQKKLVIKDMCGEGLVSGEVLSRRMEIHGIKVTI